MEKLIITQSDYSALSQLQTAMESFEKFGKMISHFWSEDRAEDIVGLTLADEYPFDSDFIELNYKIGEWVANFNGLLKVAMETGLAPSFLAHIKDRIKNELKTVYKVPFAEYEECYVYKEKIVFLFDLTNGCHPATSFVYDPKTEDISWEFSWPKDIWNYSNDK